MELAKQAGVIISQAGIFSIKMPLFALIFIFVALSLLPLSAATDGNLSISGTKTFDINSNGIRDPSDPPLEGIIIYIDENNDSRWQQNEIFVRTDRNGDYSFSISPEALS